MTGRPSAAEGPVEGPVLVVGAGLIGASVGLALQRAGVPVQIEDTDPTALAEALTRGAGQAPTRWSPPPRLVVVAVPPGSVAEQMERTCTRWPDATVTDVASVKAGPLRAAVGLHADARRLVGGHPMAGREVSGPQGARADLFDDRLWVLTPLPETQAARLDQVRSLVRTCGGVPVVMAPEDHDRAVALTSHGPQVLASLVAARLADADAAHVEVSGQGLRDVTRIAASDPALWVEILGANAGPVADVLAGVQADLDRVTAALRELAAVPADRPADPAATAVVADALRRGREGRSRVPGKHGSAAAEYAVVPVLLADRPGELARLFAAAGECAVNLEDVRIEHVLGRPSGLVELSVRPEDGETLARALREHGFDVRG